MQYVVLSLAVRLRLNGQVGASSVHWLRNTNKTLFLYSVSMCVVWNAYYCRLNRTTMLMIRVPFATMFDEYQASTPCLPILFAERGTAKVQILI